MLENIKRCFGFNFLQGPDNAPYQLYAMGWQAQTSLDYFWDGLERPLDEGMAIFQFTLSGRGVIEIKGEKFILEKGKAFLVNIPSEHRYYLPEDSSEWEFVFITLTGSQTQQEINKLVERYGHVLNLALDSPIMDLFWSIYWKAGDRKIVDGYQSSSIAYQFIMELFRVQVVSEDRLQQKYSQHIKEVIDYIQIYYFHDITLEELAQKANMSKYHFNRTFNSVIGLTPIEYLTKVRLENAMRLLVNTGYNIEEIAKLVGYSGSNYFCKVFKKYCNLTPLQFREQYVSYTNFNMNL